MNKKSTEKIKFLSIAILIAVLYFVLITADGFSGSSSTTGTTTTSGESEWIYGLIGLVVIFSFLGLIIYFIIKSIKKIMRTVGKTPQTHTTPMQYKFDQSLVGNLKAYDPDFSPELFMEKVNIIATRLQEAWSEGDMMPVRNYVSQGIFNRFRLQLELMIEEEEIRNLVADYKIKMLSALALSKSKCYETLHVKMDCNLYDVIVNAGLSKDEKQKILAKTPKVDLTEIYSFTRKIGVKTNTSRDWLKGECPRCGYIPDNFSENNKCQSCGSIYNSGEFDWVLSEITQPIEWREDSWSHIEGLSELEGKNLSMNRQVIEDRASYLFWRWVYSLVKGSATPLARDAVPRFLKVFPQQKHKFYNTAIGAVDLISVKVEEKDAIAKVKIYWSTALQKNDKPCHKEHMFTMKMPVALKNPYGLGDHSCDTCGAPLPETDALKCTYCGGNLATVVNDWILLQIDEIHWERGEH